MLKFLILLFFIPLSLSAENILFKKSKLLYFSTNFQTLKHVQLEIGFTNKKTTWGYSYQTFVTPFLFQSSVYEDSIDSTRLHVRTNLAALGVKFGFILPINEDEPLYFQLAIGHAKLNVQKNPFFGQKTDSILNIGRWAAHFAFIFTIDDILLRMEYTLSGQKFTENQLIYSLGLNF
jgi:hypothetical protein